MLAVCLQIGVIAINLICTARILKEMVSERNQTSLFSCENFRKEAVEGERLVEKSEVEYIKLERGI